MIKLMVIGNLGKDCTTNNVNGNNVINFSVAHTEKFKEKEKTIWVECAYWTEKTGIVPYLKKGTQVYVEGTPDLRTYTTQDGKQGASLSLRVNSVQLLGGKQNGGEGYDSDQSQNNSYRQNQPAKSFTDNEPSDASDDLPF